VCESSGWLITSGGNLPVAGISEAIGQATTASAGVDVSGALTENFQGLVCSFTLVSGATNSFYTIGANGTGTLTQTWAPVASNPPACGSQFVSHAQLAIGVGVQTLVGTDPTSTIRGTCYPQ
jgi:hypothetical protein